MNGHDHLAKYLDEAAGEKANAESAPQDAKGKKASKDHKTKEKFARGAQRKDNPTRVQAEELNWETLQDVRITVDGVRYKNPYASRFGHSEQDWEEKVNQEGTPFHVLHLTASEMYFTPHQLCGENTSRSLCDFRYF